MSANLDLEERLRWFVAALGRGAFGDAAALYTESGVLDMSSVGTGVYAGREAIRDELAAWFEPYEGYTAKVREFRDLGNGVTFVVVLYTGRLAGSISLLDTRHGYTVIWSDELVERVTGYGDIDEARAAAERLAESKG